MAGNGVGVGVARFLGLGFLLLLAACDAAPGPMAEAARGPQRFRAVLVAGDPSLPVWDNATRRMEAGLLASGQGIKGKIARVTSRHEEIEKGGLPGGRQMALRALVSLRPAPGEGCFVFITSHGAPNYGLVFMPGPEVLSPALLDRTILAGCGDAPTVVVASGCYSGDFAAGDMARDNRVVMTAARADRPSFGCGAGFTLTVFDDCLLQSMAEGGAVEAVWGRVRACVGREETRQGTQPSEPQVFIGAKMRGLILAPSLAFTGEPT